MIVVIGATGSIGSQVVKQLDAKGQKVRALVRDTKKGESLKSKNVDLVQGDLTKPETLGAAFQGADAVFVLSSGETILQEKNAFDAAKKAGVKHVVLLSVAGADPSSPIRLASMHGQSEKSLKASGLGYTVLQPTSFMQNTLGNAATIKAEGKMYGAFGTGKVPSVDVVDIAATAAAILANPKGHEGKGYYLTGPEALSMQQVADHIGKAIGKTVTYVDIGSAGLVANMKKMGMPDWLAEDFGKMSDYMATGSAATVSDAVEKITGRKGRNIDAFLADNAAAFK